jgi:hypothetical protein
MAFRGGTVDVGSGWNRVGRPLALRVIDDFKVQRQDPRGGSCCGRCHAIFYFYYQAFEVEGADFDRFHSGHDLQQV